MTRKPKIEYKNQRGFSHVVVLTAIVMVVGVCAIGWYVAVHSKDETTNNKQKASTTQSTASADKKQSPSAPDPYKDWKSYANSTYGIAFKYPADWRVEEVEGTQEAATVERSLTTRFAINVKRSEDVKYNNVISLEVLNQSFQAATESYDRYFAQAPAHPVTKSMDPLKGKQSVQYKFPDDNTRPKLYLFDSGGITYLFSSTSEELALQTDADYWNKFGKVFDSFELNP